MEFELPEPLHVSRNGEVQTPFLMTCKQGRVFEARQRAAGIHLTATSVMCEGVAV